MAFLEYLLLALLGTAGTASPGTPARTFTADAVTQPSGGTEGVGQKKPNQRGERDRDRQERPESRQAASQERSQGREGVREGDKERVKDIEGAKAPRSRTSAH